MEDINNMVDLIGILAGRPIYSHSGRDEEYYTFPLSVERLSGISDTINIVLRKEQLQRLEISDQSHLHISGELRSFNNKSGIGNRLIITVLARQISFVNDDAKNVVHLRGALCKPPNFRQTPMGREICDLMLAVNRHYGRSDYIPCIAWGHLAKSVAEFPVGTNLSLSGRIQSRTYTKIENDIQIEKIAFEVSVTDMKLIEMPNK